MSTSRIKENRELALISSSWADALRFGEADLERLLADVPTELLVNADKSSPGEDAIEVIMSDEWTCLWLGSFRLARVAR